MDRQNMKVGEGSVLVNSMRFLLEAAAVMLAVIPQNRMNAQFPREPAVTNQFPFVSTIFGDNMVLQRGKPDTIWGWSEPGDTVHVQIGTHSASGVAGADRRWQVKIAPPAAGGPYTVKITGRRTVEFHNVMVGDVWLCGGQSNMEFPLMGALTGAADAKAANYPNIRYFTVFGHPAYQPVNVITGSWKVVSPETAGRLSAVAFYFARRVQQQIHVPIGLVVDAVGGTPAEAWTSAAALRPLKDYDAPLAALQKISAEGGPEYGNWVMPWYDEYDVGLKQQWYAPEYDDSDWKQVTIPGAFADLGVPVTPAVAWFRREITLPDPLPSGRALIFLGIIQRMDTVYINGHDVGGSAWVENPRVYFLRPGVLKPGKNLIAIRVFKTEPHGGFLSPPDVLRLMVGAQISFPPDTRTPPTAKLTIPLAGQWKGKISVDARPPHPLPISYENWPVMPTVLYKGMLKPIAPLSITGALWYQAEQNSPRGYEYRKLLPAMIADWRNLFGQGNFPFYIVSLPAFQKRSPVPTDDGWADIRESLALTAEKVPNSCLAVTIDTGDPDSIHARDKEPVGNRLALCALAKHYHKHVAYSGPTLESVQHVPGAIRLRFDHANGGLIAKGGKLEGFSIAGDDRKFYWADARIKGNTVLVSSPSVPHPVAVRYDWQSNPAATLFNGAGLPADPFRTDVWPLVTQGVRPY
jgi:sialate O-acetylesterase